MRIGSLVKFTAPPYDSWGLGLILREHVGQSGLRYAGVYCVITQLGEQVVYEYFMEEVSDHPF